MADPTPALRVPWMKIPLERGGTTGEGREKVSRNESLNRSKMQKKDGKPGWAEAIAIKSLAAHAMAGRMMLVRTTGASLATMALP